MASLDEFKDFLRTEAERSLHEIEHHLKKLVFGKPEQFEAAKVDISHRLNTIYFEMLDFLTWLEQENKKIRSRNVKVLIDDLRKDIDKVRDFQEYVSTLSGKDTIFKNPGLQQNLVKRAQNLASELLQYVDELAVLEQELLDATVILKRADDFLFATPEAVGKIKQRVAAAKTETFLSQRTLLASSVEALQEQLDEEYQRLANLRKIPALRRVLASLELAKKSLGGLSKAISKADPKSWKQSAASFEYFQKRLLEDLEGIQKVFAISAEDLQDVRKQLAA